MVYFYALEKKVSFRFRSPIESVSCFLENRRRSGSHNINLPRIRGDMRTRRDSWYLAASLRIFRALGSRRFCDSAVSAQAQPFTPVPAVAAVRLRSLVFPQKSAEMIFTSLRFFNG
jgi:hypothetical protein